MGIGRKVSERRKWTAVLATLALVVASAGVWASQMDGPVAGGAAAVAPQAYKPVSAPAAAPVATAPAGQRIFYATHSLMWDVPDPLTEEVKAFGVKEHVIAGVQRMGFSRTQQQWDQGTQAKQALQTGKIDAFIMSPMDMPDKGVENFVMLGVQNNPNMRFYVQNNWAGFNNDGQKAQQSMQLMMSGKLKSWDQTTEEDLKTLNTECEKAFEAQVKDINQKLGHDVLFIIPTSQANTEGSSGAGEAIAALPGSDWAPDAAAGGAECVSAFRDDLRAQSGGNGDADDSQAGEQSEVR
jgi:hypothetical protein